MYYKLLYTLITAMNNSNTMYMQVWINCNHNNMYILCTTRPAMHLSPGASPLPNSYGHHVCQLWNACRIQETHPYMTSMRLKVTLSMREQPICFAPNIGRETVASPPMRMRKQSMHHGYMSDLRNPDQNTFWTEIRIANEMKWNTRI